jgi:hypothetical protein
MPALAASCKSSGALTYLGNIRDQTQSVWLSRTDLGSFTLESAQGQQTVDNWDVPPSRRLRISISPVVSNGNGGTHRLFETSDSKPCLIDTHNQTRDFKLPPFITDNVRPPIEDLFPDFGIRPPIGTLPSRPQVVPRLSFRSACFHLLRRCRRVA